MSSRFAATITDDAFATRASCSTAVLVAEPCTTASPRAVASRTAVASGSTTTIWFSSMPSATSASTALRPFVPYPQMTT